MTLLAMLRHAETAWSAEGRIQGRTDELRRNGNERSGRPGTRAAFGTATSTLSEIRTSDR